MKSKSQTLFPVLIVAIMLLLSCNNNSDEIKVGAILPLTGDAAFLGKDIKNGIDLELSQFNKDNKVKIKIVYEDSKAQPNFALASYEKLKAENIKLIIGPAASSEVLALAKSANKDHIILFSPSASSPDISNSGDFIFRNELSDNLGATKQAELAIEKLGWKNIGIIYVNNDYGVGVNLSFTKEFSALGGKIIFDKAYQAGLQDFRPFIANINPKTVDGIFIIAQGEYPNIIRQIRTKGLTTKIMATPVFENKDFISQLGRDYSEGIIYAYYGDFDVAAKDSISQKFNSQYQSTYSSQPSYYGALGYDNASIVCDVLLKSNFKWDKIKDLLYQVKDFKGVTGTLSIDKNGDVDKPIFLKIVRGENFYFY